MTERFSGEARRKLKLPARGIWPVDRDRGERRTIVRHRVQAGLIGAATLGLFGLVLVGAATDANAGGCTVPPVDARGTGTIQAAVDAAKPGDTVVIPGGVYRESVLISISGTASAPIVIEGAAGEEVVLNGAEVIPQGEWTQVSGTSIWAHSPWTHSEPSCTVRGKTYTPEQVIVDGGAPLRQASGLDTMTAGSFYSDPLGTQTLYAWLSDGGSPTGHTIEVAVRPVLMDMTGSNLIVRNFTFRYGTNNLQHGVLVTSGSNNLVEDCIIEWTFGAGAVLNGNDNIYRRVISRFNGQIGMKAFGVDNQMDECQLIGNNVNKVPKAFEAGGIKIVRTRRFNMVRCISQQNDGPGVWFDIDNRDGVIEQSYVADNDGPGIKIEISQNITARNNLCFRNGAASRKQPGRWAFAGILLAEAMNCTVEHNVCVKNRVGIAVRQQGIRTLQPAPDLDQPDPISYYSDQHVFRQNISSFNKRKQFALFGDNPFFGLLNGETMPSASDLALLNPDLRGWISTGNVYTPGKYRVKRGKQVIRWRLGKLILWGASWRPDSQVYRDLASFETDHNLEQGSIVANPLFVDWKKGNFDLLPESPAIPLGAGFTQPPIQP